MKFDVIQCGLIAVARIRTPKYVVPTSNFTNAYIVGVPCKVLGDPYPGMWKSYIGEEKRILIDVQSCVTGIKYTIPYSGFLKEFDSLVEANDEASIIGHHFPDIKDLIGKPYWPRDDSYITDAEGNWKDLFHKECEIISVPYTEKVNVKGYAGESYDVTFVLVRYEGKTYRVMFQEDGLVDVLDFLL